MNAVLKAKKEFKHLYYIKVDKETAIIFRGLTWGEFKEYRSLLLTFPEMEPDVFEDIFSDCTIEFIAPGMGYRKWSDDFTNGYMSMNNLLEFIPAGVVNMMVNFLMSRSGAMNAEKFMEDLAQARQYAPNAFEDRITSMVSTIFRMKKDDWDNMEWEDVLNNIVQGELILSGQVLETPFGFETKSDKDKINFDKENKDYNNA